MKLTATLSAALLALAAGSAVCAQAPAVDRPTNEGAAATIYADALMQLDSLGVKIDPERFLALLRMRLVDGTDVGFASVGEASAWIADAVRPPVLAPLDPETENAWVAAQLSRPRTEVIPGGTVLQRLVDGSGPMPALSDTVCVSYTARLSDGTVFDSVSEEKPFMMPVANVVPGLRTALQRMRLGGTYRVFIPPAEAYGTRAIMDVIPANAALDFEIMLYSK